MLRTASFPLLLAAGLLLAGCQSGGATPRRPLEPSSAVSGGTRGGGRPDRPDPAASAEEEKRVAEERRAKAAEEKAAKEKEAEDLWTRAQAERDPDDAADLYRDLADEHKSSPHAEEARWLQGVKRYEAGEWNEAVLALTTYVTEYPVNPHLAEAERMLYDASLKVFEWARGLLGVFRSEQRGIDGLNAIVERFPEGQYADDALLALGDYYARKDEYASACLQYRSLLLRYPDSEWSFQARLRLADAYFARDQGANYHAGFVDLDPRVSESPGYAQGRPVRSCLEGALENYQAFLDRIAADPARRTEYAPQVAHAQARVEECRRRLAEKDRAVAGYYAGRGQGTAAGSYRAFAERTEQGRPWSEGVPPPRALATTPPPAAPAPEAPAPAAPRVATTPAAPPAALAPSAPLAPPARVVAPGPLSPPVRLAPTPAAAPPPPAALPPLPTRAPVPPPPAVLPPPRHESGVAPAAR